MKNEFIMRILLYEDIILAMIKYFCNGILMCPLRYEVLESVTINFSLRRE